MRRCALVLSIVVTAIAGVVLDAGAQSSVSDDFDDGSLDECKWRTFFVGSTGSVSETNQQLRVALGPSAGSSFQAGVRSTWYVNDDYDIQVDYHLLYWPPWNGIRVGMAVDADGLVERVRFNNAYSDFPGHGQDVYLTDFGDGVAGIKASIVGTTHTSGTLRLIGNGSTVSGYFWTGTYWQGLRSISIDRNWGTRVVLYIWGHYSSPGALVAFDNFRVNYGTIAMDGSACAQPPVAQTECAPRPSDMVSWWPGDDNALDIVGGNDGEPRNGATFASGLVGQAFSFDGLDDYVQVTSGPFDFGSAAFSTDFWMYPNDSAPVTAYLIGKSLPDWGQGFDIRLKNSTIQVVGVNGWPAQYNFASDASATPNTWHHIALSSTETTVELYIDGALKGTSRRSAISSTGNPFRIGFTTHYGGVPFDGLIDEVEVFDRALTAEEIAAIYSRGTIAMDGSACAQPPVARCGDVSVEAGPQCTACAAVDAGSSDPDGDPVTITQSPGCDYALGTTVVAMTVSDPGGFTDSCSGTVTVVDSSPDLDGDGLGTFCDTDDDDDGVADEEDTCGEMANPDQADTDGDGAGDACDADDDGDGVLDMSDLCPLVAGAEQVDSDGDGRGDACDPDDDDDGVADDRDNCALTPNGGQADLDADGFGDACDGDADGDGVQNDLDSCPVGANADQADTDGDGEGDACDRDDDDDWVEDAFDNCPTLANPDQIDADIDALGDACDSDDDGDGAEDGADNCGLAPNSDQTDTDRDGAGDACDPDDDGDGVADEGDNCPLEANADQRDNEDDGRGDACDPDDDDDAVADGVDNCRLLANPDQANNDGDPLGDVCDCDDDDDGMDDGIDNCPMVANGGQGDHDGDGVGDACDPDDDGDGTEDELDNCPLMTNIDQLDTDGDYVGDACDADDDADGVEDLADNCPLTPNPEQIDYDMDGQGNECDGDLDGDGLSNEDDNCALAPNPEQQNIDGDALGDVCDPDIDGDGLDNPVDNCPADANAAQLDNDLDSLGDPCDRDDDNDAVLDDADNCHVAANSDQLDTDTDGAGNACDPDDDDDRMPDGADNCPLVANPAQDDDDEDGLGDVCDPDDDNDAVPDDGDNCVFAANGGQEDFDGDGAGDACDSDADGDGVVADVCPWTAPGEIVAPENGCSLAQLCPCAGPRGQDLSWRNHGMYQSCVAQTTRSFATAGLIDETTRAVIVQTVASSSCGR